MNKRQRQLWCIPGGEGKSRIAATTLGIAFLTGMAEKIYIVHENKHLM